MDPHKTWIYYQALVTLGTLTIAVSSVIFTIKTSKALARIERALERILNK